MTTIPLHALTLYRPWPWSFTHPAPERRKAIENRGRQPPEWLLGRHFALHAGKVWHQGGADMIRRICPEMPGSSDDHPGGIVTVARLIGHMRDLDRMTLIPGIDKEELIRSIELRWFFGPIGSDGKENWGWLVDSVVPIDPPVRDMTKTCHQGLWVVPQTELAIVRERWRAGHERQQQERLATASG